MRVSSICLIYETNSWHIVIKKSKAILFGFACAYLYYFFTIECIMFGQLFFASFIYSNLIPHTHESYSVVISSKGILLSWDKSFLYSLSAIKATCLSIRSESADCLRIVFNEGGNSGLFAKTSFCFTSDINC